MAKVKEERALTTNKIGIKEGLGYMAGDAGNLFVLTYVSSFLKIFYTDVLKIPSGVRPPNARSDVCARAWGQWSTTLMLSR